MERRSKATRDFIMTDSDRIKHFESKQPIDAFTVYHWNPEASSPEFDIELARKSHHIDNPIIDYDKLIADMYHLNMTS